MVSSIGSGLSRFFWNVIFNYTGYRFVAAINLLTQIIIYSVIRFSVLIPGLYLFLIFLSGVCFGGFTVITPTFSQIVFGTTIGSKVYGIYAQVLAISNFVQFAYVLGLKKYLTFDGIIYLCLGKAIIAFFLVIIPSFEGPWKNPTEHLGYCAKKQLTP